MNLTGAIIIGVISGILASLTIYIALIIAKNILIPWYRTLIYKGIDINGEWFSEAKFDSGNIQHMKISIKQKANKISALITISKKIANSDKIEIKTYQQDGEIRERFVTLVGRNTDKQSIGVNSILMEVVGDGKKMQGYTSRYNVTKNKITASEAIWTRENKIDANVDNDES